MLTVWNWEDEGIMLRSKAFGQDIYRVVFSKFNEGRLISGGVGHIKLWKMASTFTGLKLKGQLGKFGESTPLTVNSYHNSLPSLSSLTLIPKSLIPKSLIPNPHP